MNHKNGNYFRVPNDIFGSGIEKRAFVVYCYLSRCSDMKTRQCYPSLKTIAKACNLSVTTVRRALTDLENGGWIDIAQRFTDNGQESNLYAVLNIETTPLVKSSNKQLKSLSQKTLTNKQR